jgi:hypothetical protein
VCYEDVMNNTPLLEQYNTTQMVQILFLNIQSVNKHEVVSMPLGSFKVDPGDKRHSVA